MDLEAAYLSKRSNLVAKQLATMLNRSQRELLKEAKIRGICAAHSADMEALLFRLILYSSIDDQEAADRDFTNMTLTDKIILARVDLKKNYPDRFLKHQKHFAALNKFNKFRGRLIHCDIVWDENKDNEFRVLEVKKIKGEWRIVPITYTVKDVIKKCADFGKLIIEFAHSTKDIISIVAQKYPELNKTPQSK